MSSTVQDNHREYEAVSPFYFE